MIHSSFSYDESSVWDPKHIKQCLCISEDQLDVLVNIPGWSQTQEKNNSNSSQLQSDVNSQPSKTSEVSTSNETLTSKTSEVSTSNETLTSKTSKVCTSNETATQKKITRNFEKWSHNAKRILHSRQLKVRKRTYSFPFETNKIIDDLVKHNPLKRVLSDSDVFQNTVDLEFSYDFINKYKKLNEHKIAVLDKAYTESSVTYCEKENIVSYKLRREANSSDLFNSTKGLVVGCSSEIKTSTVFSIFKDSKISESVTKKPNPVNMEVATQLPIAAIHNENNKFEVSKNNAEKCASTDDNTHILLPNAENNTVTNVSNNDNSENLNNNNSTFVSLSSTNKHESDMSEKTNEVTKNASLSENKIASDFSCSKEMDENASSSNTHSQIHLDNQKTETSENKFQKLGVGMAEHFPESAKVINGEKSTFKANEALDKQDGAIVDPCISSNTHIHLENKQKNIIHDESKSAETAIPIKRKSESKTRSSKKRKHTREKQGQAEARNVKNASNICYTTEEVKCMLDILKQFL